MSRYICMCISSDVINDIILTILGLDTLRSVIAMLGDRKSVV